MEFVPAVKSCLTNYATFRGRACRSEYWYFALFLALVNIVARILDVTMVGFDAQVSPISAIVFVVLFLPSLAVAVRRLHDKNRTGWWYLLFFLPLIGVIVLLIWFCGKGTDGANRFGPDPLFGGDDEAESPLTAVSVIRRD